MVVEARNSTISTLQAEVDNLILDPYPRQGEWTEEEYLDLTDHTNQMLTRSSTPIDDFARTTLLK